MYMHVLFIVETETLYFKDERDFTQYEDVTAAFMMLVIQSYTKHPWCKKARPSRKHQLLLFSACD